MTDLVKPGEITAADSEDLAQALLVVNLERIDRRTDIRGRKKWADEQCELIRQRYESKAESVYGKMWRRCGRSSAGHEYRNHDSGGQTVLVCVTCGHTSCSPRKGDQDYTYKYAAEQADTMNKSLIRTMRDRMIELDKEVGILVWPTPQDYPQPVEKKQRRFWREWASGAK